MFGSSLLMLYLNHYLTFELYFLGKVIYVLLIGYIYGRYLSMYKELENDTRNETDIYYGV